MEPKNNKNKEIDDLLLDLKIISQIKENDKLITSKNVLEIDSSYFPSIKRYWNNDNRSATIDYINDVINKTLNVTDTTLNDTNSKKNIFQEDNSHILQRFLLEMTNSCKGLDNLKITYNSDITVTSAIDICKEKLQMRIEGIQKILKISVPNSNPKNEK